jgi:hypothetical protein
MPVAVHFLSAAKGSGAEALQLLYKGGGGVGGEGSKKAP